MTLPFNWVKDQPKSYVTHDNHILMADYYKFTHWLQYPKDVKYVLSFMEPRGGYSDTVLNIGLQMVIADHFEGIRIEPWMIDDAEKFLLNVGGFNEYFNRAGWERIVNVHGGKLPLKIKALPEGLVVPAKTALFTIENTDPELPWLTNWAETVLMHVWHPITVGTTSMNFTAAAQPYADMCGETVSPVLLNDFGYRGVENKVAAGRGGAAHLLSSIGTDNLEGIVYASRYYGAKFEDGVIGVSVFATEHSTTTIYGRENEHAALENFIDTAPDAAIVSLVSDSYNIYEAAKFLVSIKDKIIARKGKVVVRPDSGEPHLISHAVLEILWNGFGGTINEKGYKVLDPHIGMIYGDGINVHGYTKILDTCVKYGKFALSNIVFGMGGGLLQECTRDTHKFAIKCCAALRGDTWVDVSKDPITDPGKASKVGPQAVYHDGKKYVTCREDLLPAGTKNLLETVFENGDFVKTYTWAEVVENRRKG